ncbi:hypothetical protein D3C84_1175110 [compost metagenome]
MPDDIAHPIRIAELLQAVRQTITVKMMLVGINYLVDQLQVSGLSCLLSMLFLHLYSLRVCISGLVLSDECRVRIRALRVLSF